MTLGDSIVATKYLKGMKKVSFASDIPRGKTRPQREIVPGDRFRFNIRRKHLEITVP